MKVEDIIKSGTPLSPSKKVILNLAITQTRIGEGLQCLLKPFDVSMEQFNVLRILRGQKGKPANMSLLQERMIAKTSNTTRLVDKLLAKELVTRKICPDNRRKMEVGITPKGLELLTTLDALVEDYENSFSQKLTSEELDQLNNLLDKFRNPLTSN